MKQEGFGAENPKVWLNGLFELHRIVRTISCDFFANSIPQECAEEALMSKEQLKWLQRGVLLASVATPSEETYFLWEYLLSFMFFW